MSESRDPWLDEQLKAVPMPPDLLARLRRIAIGSDADLDAALREVPVGDDLLASLRLVPADAAMDERLRDVPIPAGLAARLMPEELQPADELEMVEEESAFVAPLIAERPRSESLSPASRFSWGRFFGWTAAACVALTVGGIVFFGTQPKFAPPHDPPLVTIGLYQEPAGTQWLAPDPPFEHLRTLAERTDEERPTPIAFAPEFAPLPRLGPEADILRIARDRVPLGQARWTLTWGEQLQTEPLREHVRDLERAADLTPHGIKAPTVPTGYDRIFQLKHGVHPIVFPAAHADLQMVRVPLVTKTGSYDNLRQLIARGDLPPTERIQVEEFIAATGIAGPQPLPGQIDLRIFAGPSPFSTMRTFGSEGQQRLPPGRPQLVAIQTAAGSVARRTRPATHLVIALDGSESMRWGNRYEHARRGIAAFVDLMGPRDYLTVVRMGVRAEVIVNRATRLDLSNLEGTLAQSPPSGPLDLGSGLRVAGDLAAQPPSDPSLRPGVNLATQLVVVTDGIDGLSSQHEARLAGSLAALGEQQVGVLLLDVSGPSAPGGSLRRLAEQGEARLMAADSSSEVRAALVEELTGGSSVLAEEAVLSVRFNPRAIAGYRLLGHEVTLAGAMIPGPVESLVLAGDQTTVLFEVWPTDSTESDVLEATLVWQKVNPNGSGGNGSNTAGSSNEQRRATLSASQGVKQWDSLPGDVQAAAIAAEAADVLRGSYFAVGRNRDLRPVLMVAERVSSTLATDPSYREFLGVLRATEQARVTRKP